MRTCRCSERTVPRRSPARVRAGLPRRLGPHDRTPIIPDLTAGALAEIDRLERSRGNLWHGAVADAFTLWREFVHNPYRRLWANGYDGCGFWFCCGDPREARDLLEGVLQSLSRRHARELHRIVARLDAEY